MGPNSTEIKLQSILSQGWLYRGEGNANIVLSLPKTHQILRIRKVDKPTTILGWFFDWIIQIFQWERKKDMGYESKNLDFYNQVMIPLLGKSYAQSAVNIGASRKEIQRLDRELVRFRPEYRKHKCLQFGKATLFADYAFLSNKWSFVDFIGESYAVEIKPKQGWIPFADRVYDKCQFCLNQHLKLKNGQIKELSSYCPLDLFSGDKDRMIKALKSLISNPQNNLRIFKNGIYCYGEDTPTEALYDVLHLCFENSENSIISLIDDFCDMLVQALLKDFHKNKGCENCDDNYNTLPHKNTYFSELKQTGCVFGESKLPQGCILDKILSAQSLNRSGLNKYYSIYKALTNKGKCDNWTYVEHLLEEISRNKLMCPSCIITNRTKKHLDLDLVPYLIAAVANDCSFMIAFRKISNCENVPAHFVVSAGGSKFLINVGVFDLYPKPLSTIEKHVKRNLKVQNAYICSK